MFGDYPSELSLLKHYTAIVVPTVGRSEEEAYASAVAALDLLRGLWNLILNRRRRSRLLNQRRKPVNAVLLGPVHSLHEPSGALVPFGVWYEDDYVGPTQTNEVKKRWEWIVRNEEVARSYLNRHPYRPRLEGFLREYARALDVRDWNSAFLRLWGLLERLTGTGATETHQATTKRAAFLFAASDRGLHKQVLNHLRDHRNRGVHLDERAENAEALLFQLKHYVEVALELHLENHYGFASFGDAVRFLDQPADMGDLDAKIAKVREELRLAKLARKFHDGGGDS